MGGRVGKGTRLHPLCSSKHLNFLSGTPDYKITFFTNCLGSSNSGMQAEIMHNTLSSSHRSPHVSLHAYFPFCRELGDYVKDGGMKEAGISK